MTTPDPHTEARQQLYELLGPLPPRDRPVAAKVVRTDLRDGYQIENLLLDLNAVSYTHLPLPTILLV